MMNVINSITLSLNKNLCDMALKLKDGSYFHGLFIHTLFCVKYNVIHIFVHFYSILFFWHLMLPLHLREVGTGKPSNIAVCHG